MAFEQREMSGALFRSKKATGNQPTYTGDCKINGEVYRIGAWVKETQSGDKFFSLAFSEPYRGGEENQDGGNVQQLDEYNDGDDPF